MRANSNVAMLFSLMHRICQVMGEYFKEVEEESIRDNFVICYELLDELVDFGYPQTTDAKILQEYITQVRRGVRQLAQFKNIISGHRNLIRSIPRHLARVLRNVQ